MPLFSPDPEKQVTNTSFAVFCGMRNTLDGERCRADDEYKTREPPYLPPLYFADDTGQTNVIDE
jgi:hypothetical protein